MCQQFGWTDATVWKPNRYRTEDEHTVRVAYGERTLCVLAIRRHTSKNFVHAQKSSTYCAKNSVCQRTATNGKRTQTDELPNFNVYQRMSTNAKYFHTVGVR